MVKYYIICICFAWFFVECWAVDHLKIWKPTTDIFDRNSWVDPNSKEDCRRVEFGTYNTDSIDIKELAAETFILPRSGWLAFENSGSLKIVEHNSKIKTNCLKLKEFRFRNFFDPSNWISDLSNNPAVPDQEKLPCRDDTIKLNRHSSDMFVSSSETDLLVSKIIYNNITISGTVLEMGSRRLLIYGRQCHDPTGCVCNNVKNMYCDELEEEAGCLSPVHPKGFCHPICGAFTTFKPMDGFSLKKMQEELKTYSDVFTHVSKVDDDVIQLVFAEKEYSGDSVMYAEEFYEKLKEKSAEFKITDLKSLKLSGSRTSGGASFVLVFFASLVFVFGLFALIFCVYGDRRWITNLRFRTPTNFPLTSTYRARFSSREDESGLIFDTQSIAGSVLNLRQSFDNPMFGDESVASGKGKEEKVDTSEVNILDDKPNESRDPLYDLKKLNMELKEEIGSEIVEDLHKSLFVNTALLTDVPLIEVDENNDQ